MTDQLVSSESPAATARRLCRMIKDYWAGRGSAVTPVIVDERNHSHNETLHCIRSDMRNGLPQVKYKRMAAETMMEVR